MKVDLEPRERHIVLLKSHGNELKIATELQHMFEEHNIPDIFYMPGHLLAAFRNVRYVKEDSGSKEIMSCYRGNLYGDPQEVAAARNMGFIDWKKPLVVFDMHEHNGTSSFFSVGRRTTIPAIAGARLLNKDTCLVEDASFFRHVPNGVAIENSLKGADPRSITEEMYQGFRDIASVRLREVSFADAVSGVRFFQKFDIYSTDHNGQIVEYLEALENIVPNVPPHAPFDLPDELRKQLLIPSEAETAYDTWGHYTMAEEDPDRLGFTKTKKPRREVFGSVLISLEHPREEDENVIFDIEDRPLSRKPEGLLRLAAL